MSTFLRLMVRPKRRKASANLLTVRWRSHLVLHHGIDIGRECFNEYLLESRDFSTYKIRRRKINGNGVGYSANKGVWTARLIELQTRDRKVAGSIPGRGGGRIFFSIIHFLC